MAVADDFDYLFNIGQGGGCIPVEITPSQCSHTCEDGETGGSRHGREGSQDFLAVELTSPSHRKSKSSHSLSADFNRLNTGSHNISEHSPFRRHSNYSLFANRDGQSEVQLGAPTKESSFASRQRTGSTYRILVLGGEGVGKTALTHQFLTTDDIDEAEIEDDGEEKNCCVSVDGKESSLIFMDLDYNKNTYDPSAANAYIVVYSCTDPESFAEARAILKNLRHFEKDKAIILCGNKIDLARRRKMSTEEGSKLASHYDAEFIETSTTLNHRIDNLLVGIVSQIRNQIARRAKHKAGPKPKKSAKMRSKTTDLRRSVHGFMDKIVGKSRTDVD